MASSTVVVQSSCFPQHKKDPSPSSPCSVRFNENAQAPSRDASSSCPSSTPAAADSAPATAATPPEEISRQHEEAVHLVGCETLPTFRTWRDFLAKSQHEPVETTFDQEIPLHLMEHSIVEISRTDQPDAAEPLLVYQNSEIVPLWASRGQVDVTLLRDLILEGYNETPKTPKPAASAPKSSSTSISAPGSPKSASVAKPVKKGNNRRPQYTARDITSITNLWQDANAAIHNVAISRPSHDAWGIRKIVLVYCDDFCSRIYDFPWWRGTQSPSSAFQEAMEPILRVLQIQPSQIVRMLFAALPPNVTIPVHHDSGEWVKQTHRVHVPILVDNPAHVLFRVGYAKDQLHRLDCTPGHVFELNNQCWHAVSNTSSTHYRVHLILDYVDAAHVVKLPTRILLTPGERLWQTRRSIDRCVDHGSRPTPSFLILGAQKAGTTSLYEYMIQHPLIVAAKRRETHCLDWRWNGKLPSVEERREWCRQFYHTGVLEKHPSCLTGDSTPSYLLDSVRVIPRLRSVFNWPMKFLVMVREPIQRGESHFAMVTSPNGTPEQLKARGMEWRNKTMEQVVMEDLSNLLSCGVVPYWDKETGTVDESIWSSFVDSPEEDAAWERYLRKHVLLNSGSYGLLSRGLYALNLRPWLRAFSPEALESSTLATTTYASPFLVIDLEQMESGGVQSTMSRVWSHLDLPDVRVIDSSPRNTRAYESSLSPTMVEYLQRFYQPHNQRLTKILGPEWRSLSWFYSKKLTDPLN
jgi:Aspartyl/Asparaginyl beta-hydroxylase